MYLLASLLAKNQGPVAEEHFDNAASVGKMAFACVMHSWFPLSEKAVTLHQKCVAEKLDWARRKHAPVTHLCPCTDASKSGLLSGIFFPLQHC